MVHRKDGSPTAYLVRCRHCGTHLANSDSDQNTPEG